MSIKKEHLVFGALALLFLIVLSYEAIFFESHMGEGQTAHHSEMHALMAGRMGPSLLGFNVLFWILILTLAFFLLKGTAKGAQNENAAVKILNERYAKGEITREEYLEKFRDIKEG